MAPTLATAPSADEVAAIPCPFRQVAVITEVARRCGTLPPVLAALRRAALAECRTRASVGKTSHRVGMSRSRIFRLTRPQEATS